MAGIATLNPRPHVWRLDKHVYIPQAGVLQLMMAKRLSVIGTAFALGMAVTAWAADPETATLVAAETAGTAAIIDPVRLSGTVVAPRVAQVSAAIAGLVETIGVDAGDRVAKGAPLLELDDTLAEFELRRSEAAAREAAERLADARRRFDEVKRLEGGRSIAQTELLSREAEVRVATAAAARLEAEREHQAELVERHRLPAPFAGVVSRKLTEAGEWIEPGTPVVELVALDGLRLDFQAPQAYFPRIAKGTPVSVQLDALPERRYDGRVTAVVPVSDPAARTFTLHVRLTDGGVPMTPGMSAEAHLELETGRRAVVVSRDALIRYPDGRVTVWVVEDKDGAPAVSERQVRTGLAFDGRIEIRSGLDAGARVVVKGNEVLRPGQRVRLEQRP